MLEKVEEILSSLKERLTSPFISSFLISWLVSNWKITVGLFFIDSEQLKQSGFNNLSEYLEPNINWCHGFFIPILFAFAYTFLYPYLRNWINEFLVRRKRDAEKKEIEILKDSSIPMDRFLKMRNHYEKRQGDLEEIIKKESSYSDLIGTLQNDLNLARSLSNEKQLRINNLDKNFSEISSKYNELFMKESNQKLELNQLKKEYEILRNESSKNDTDLGRTIEKSNQQKKQIEVLTSERIELENQLPQINKHSPNGSILFELLFSFPIDIFNKIFKLSNPNYVNIYTAADFTVGKFYMITKNANFNMFDFIMRYDFEANNIVNGIIEFIIRPKDDYAIYTKIAVQNSKHDYWFCHQFDKKQFKINNDNAPYEYFVPVYYQELKNNWYSVQFEISKALDKTFSPAAFSGICGFQFRGTFDIARIRIYQATDSPIITKTSNKVSNKF